MVNWFIAHGAKLLAFITGVIGLLSTQAMQLGISQQLLAWLTFISAVATLASTVFFTSEDQQAAKAAMKGPKP
jgi:hypothetical protein